MANKIGALLLILVIPLPYYIRLIIFYLYESEERNQRLAVTKSYDLQYSFEHSLLAYYGPGHWMFVLMYVICFLSVVVITYLMTRHNEQCIRKIMIDSFYDYHQLHWTRIWKLFVSNCVFPLKRFKLWGCIIGIIYWPIAIPITLFVCLWFLFPTTYIFSRMIYHSIYGGLRVVPKHCKIKRYKMSRGHDTSLDYFTVESWIRMEMCVNSCEVKDTDFPLLLKPRSFRLSEAYTPTERQRKFLKYLFAVILCILSTIGALLLLSECLGFLVEMIIFTLMGLIINAGYLIRYVTFALLIIGYSYDCFNNVTTAYRRLNKAIFLTLQGYLAEDLNLVTSELACKQENTGFIINALTDAERGRQPTTQNETETQTDPATSTADLVGTGENVREEATTRETAETGIIDTTNNNNCQGRQTSCHEVESDNDSSDSDWDFMFVSRDDYDSEDGLRPFKDNSVEKVPIEFKHVQNLKPHWNINDLVVFMDNRDMPRIPRRLFDEVCNIKLNGLPGPLYDSYARAFRQLGLIIIFLMFVGLAVRSFGIHYKTSLGTDLILTVISGIIPKILTSFLYPKPPEVEVRNMNFKTRMNHILSNYNEWWPLHDFPFTKLDTTVNDEKIDYLILVNGKMGCSTEQDQCNA